MTLPPKLESSFKTKINQYEEEKKIEFLSTIEEMAIERGQEIGAKQTYWQNICLLYTSDAADD